MTFDYCILVNQTKNEMKDIFSDKKNKIVFFNEFIRKNTLTRFILFVLYNKNLESHELEPSGKPLNLLESSDKF